MKVLTADYGYDVFYLDLTDDEAQSILDKEAFSKTSPVYSETEVAGMIEATWTFKHEEDMFVIDCENGAVFNAYEYQID